jgi:hypothetical protein
MAGYLLPALAAVVALAASITAASHHDPCCRTCRQSIRGSYAADPDAADEATRWRCWPTCPGL